MVNFGPPKAELEGFGIKRGSPGGRGARSETMSKKLPSLPTKWSLLGSFGDRFGIISGVGFRNDFWHRFGIVFGRFWVPAGVQV